MNSKGQKILTDLEEMITSMRLTLIKTIGNIVLILTDIKEIEARTSRTLAKKNLRGITRKAKKVKVHALAGITIPMRVSKEEIWIPVTMAVMRAGSTEIGQIKWQNALMQSAKWLRKAEKSLIRNEIFLIIIATNRLILKLKTLKIIAETGKILVTSTKRVTELNGLGHAKNKSTVTKVDEMIPKIIEVTAVKTTSRKPRKVKGRIMPQT